MDGLRERVAQMVMGYRDDMEDCRRVAERILSLVADSKAPSAPSSVVERVAQMVRDAVYPMLIMDIVESKHLAERILAETGIAELREALENAAMALRHAWEMFDAICQNDPSVDRIKSRDKAAAAHKAARAALSGKGGKA